MVLPSTWVRRRDGRGRLSESKRVVVRDRVNRSYIFRLERDLKSPAMDMLFRLCRTLGVSAAEMIARCESK